MNRMGENETKKHIQEVLDLLPKGLRGIKLWGTQADIGCAELGFTGTSYGIPSMKVSVDYSFRDVLGFRQRSWKRRQDGKYAYDRIAAHIMKIVEKVAALERRRKEGETLASTRAAKLLKHFKTDKLLGSLNLNLEAEAVRNTETGVARIDFSAKVGNTVTGSLISYDGETFEADFTAMGLNPEQVLAVLAVLRLDQLNLLELITLADDSILGPSIRRMTAGQ